MSLLVEMYGLTEEQEKKLFEDGLISISLIGYWEIFKHYRANMEMYSTAMDNIEDCCLHFNCHYTTVYRAINRFKNGPIS